MSARSFHEHSVPYGDRGHRVVADIVCAKCGRVDTTPTGTGSSTLPDEVIGKKFKAMGWIVGGSAKGDECPQCISKPKEKPVLKVVGQANHPREMGRDDRRIIFEKLNETYVDEKTGYDTGWSDHRVASDLGVPRKWVEQVREEMFGSIGTNAEMSEYLTQATEILDEARRYLAAAEKARKEVEAVLSRPEFGTVNSIIDRLSKLDRLANEVRKLVVQP